MTKKEHRELVEKHFGKVIEFRYIYVQINGYLNRDWRQLPVPTIEKGVVIGGRWLRNVRYRVWPYDQPVTSERIPVFLVKVSPWRPPVNVAIEGVKFKEVGPWGIMGFIL